MGSQLFKDFTQTLDSALELRPLVTLSGLRELLRHLVLKPFLLNLGTISSVHRPAPCKLSLLIALCLVSVTSIILTYMVDRQKFLVKYNKVSTALGVFPAVALSGGRVRALNAQIPQRQSATRTVDCPSQNAY